MALVAARTARHFWLSWPVLVVVLLLLVGGGTAAAGCKLAWACHGHSIPLIGRMFPAPYRVLGNLEHRGTGKTALPHGFVQTTVVSGLTLPTSFTRLPDGRLLIAEKAGLVKVVRPGHGQPRVALALSREVDDWSDRGILDIEASPDFARSGHVYLLYSYDDPRDKPDTDGIRTARVSRFTMTGNSLSKRSEKVILGSISTGSCNDHPPGSDCIPVDFSHSGGAIRFAPDGNMFITTGDGSGNEKNFIHNALRVQNLESLAGKVLHVTPQGKGLPSNPFWTGDPNDARSKVWAYGLRNPFRFAIRPGTKQIYLGDVGSEFWEEVDVVDKPGENFGWPCYEGDEKGPDYKRQPECRKLYEKGRSAVKFPLVTYPRATAIGGIFYEGKTWPSQLHGAYIYGDWQKSWIKYLIREPDGKYSSTPRDLAAQAAGPVELEMGPDGNLYYLALNLGQVRRISFHG
jgi:glucose/arabinose dehydrogenase